MSANPDYLAFPANWNAQDLADAVPLRLFELFDITVNGACACNASTLRLHAVKRNGYLPAEAFNEVFRIYR